MFVNPKDPEIIIKEKGLVQISDESALLKIVVEIIDNNNLKMRVWERGIGETFSCTTGSCACVAALNLIEEKLLNRNVVQHGGNLLIEVDDTETMSVTGNCTTIFKGTLLNSGG